MTNTPVPSDLSMIAGLREHQRGLVTAMKKLVARSESKLSERLEEIEKELSNMSSMVREQKKELVSLKEYTNVLMYAVGGKSRDSAPLLSVVRAGVEKVFSSSNILPVLRKAFLSWSVVGLLDEESSVVDNGPIAVCDTGASVLNTIFVARPTASKRNENIVRSEWLKSNQKLRALVARAMLNYFINDRSTENYVRVPGTTAEQSKPSWISQSPGGSHGLSVAEYSRWHGGCEGAEKDWWICFRFKGITETVVHRVHSVVVAYLNRSRERMRTSFFTNCGFMFDKRVKVLFSDGDCRPVSAGLSAIPLAKTGYDISSCIGDVEENEVLWTTLKQECAYMSFFVHYEVDVYPDPGFSEGGEKKLLRGIINALHVALELCLSFTQFSTFDEFFIASERRILMVYMVALVVRDIIVEKVSDDSCAMPEEGQGDTPRSIEELSTCVEPLSMLQLCALMQPPSSTARARILQKNILRMTKEKFENFNTTVRQDPERSNDKENEGVRDDDDAALSDDELNDLINE